MRLSVADVSIVLQASSNLLVDLYSVSITEFGVANIPKFLVRHDGHSLTEPVNGSIYPVVDLVVSECRLVFQSPANFLHNPNLVVPTKTFNLR